MSALLNLAITTRPSRSSLTLRPLQQTLSVQYRQRRSLPHHLAPRCATAPQLPPQPPTLPFLGNAAQLDFGVRDADIIQEVLVRRADAFSKPDTRERLERWFGEGIVLQTDVPKHAAMRELLSPAFRGEYLRCMLSTMAAAGQRFAEQLEAKAGEIIEIEDALHCLTLDILGLTTFDYEFGAISSIDSTRMNINPEKRDGFDILQAHKDVVGAGMLLALGLPLPNFLLPGYKKYEEGLDHLDMAVKSIIDARVNAGPDAWAAANDVTAFLLRAQYESGGKFPDDRQIRDEVIGLLFAGSETTAQTLSFLLYCLARHPEAAAAAAEEAQTVLGGKAPSDLTLEDIKQLRITTACINEAMRLYPVAVDTPRFAPNDETIGEYFVPAGTRIFLNQYSLHRHEEYWPRPEEFLPERFLPSGEEALGPRHPHAFLPFGAGSRSCIGRQFAMLSMQIIAAQMLLRLRFEFVPGHAPLELSQAMSMKAEGGMQLKVQKAG